jgi:thiamine biosynthesis protein ThiI
MKRFIVIHYAEIGLKGKNRPVFERQLGRNVARQLAGLDVGSVQRRRGRLLVPVGPEVDATAVNERLRTVPGIAYFAIARSAPRDLPGLQEVVLEEVAGRSVGSFKIDTKRADKGYPLTSVDINIGVGAFIQESTGWAVNLSQPELAVRIELLDREALVFTERVEGLGGLPVGASGTVGLLLSGGIDSPVAAYFALKRGCRVVPIHFHSGPFGDWLGSEEKVRSLVQALKPYGLEQQYYVVPIGELQQEIVVETPSVSRIVLYRRLMVRIGQELIQRDRGLALVTGESLGQVSSQTLESLRAIQAVAKLPILRPLIGLDKLEIIRQAEVMGTYEISIEDSDDCCQFLMPRQVRPRPPLEEIERAEANVDVERLVRAGVEAARVVKLSG